MAKESTYIQDFVAGLDPTGVRSFRSSVDNKERHKRHQLVGTAGGVIGGAVTGAVAPAALTAAAAKLTKRRNPNVAKDLAHMAQGSMEAFSPQKLKKYTQSLKHLGKHQRYGLNLIRNVRNTSGRIDDLSSEVSKLHPKNLSYEKIRDMPRTAGQSKEKLKRALRDGQKLRNQQKRLDQHGRAISQKFFGGKPISEGSIKALSALSTVGSAGLGGGLAGTSAYLQYNQGQKIRRRIEEAEAKGGKPS